MSNIRFIKEKLDDIIDFSICKSNGSQFTKSVINKNKGDIPVYGASNNENEVSYGYVKDNLVITDKNGKKIEIKYFEDCLTWNIDGSIAVFHRKGRFSLSEKVIPLVVFNALKDKVNLDYIKFCISQSKEINNFGFSNKAGKSKLKEICIPMPVTEDGEYDIEIQNHIAEKYEILEEKKSTLSKYKHKLEESLIEADLTGGYNHKSVKITDLFNPEMGDAKLVKAYCNKHKGAFPVYSGNTKKDFFNIDSYNYDGTYLSWCIDGLAGYMMVISGKFSTTCHRGVLNPKEDTDINNLDMEYLKYIIEPILRKNIKGRMGHDGENEYTSLKLNVFYKIKQKISIPIDKDGKFDLIAQQEIAQKYKKLYEVKDGICKRIEKLVSTQISLIE